jgi:hypothetical protein
MWLRTGHTCTSPGLNLLQNALGMCGIRWPISAWLASGWATIPWFVWLMVWALLYSGGQQQQEEEVLLPKMGLAP